MKSERCRSTSLTAHHFFTLLNFVVLLIAVASLFCNMYLLRREIESVKTDVRPLLERHKEMSSRQSADIVFRSRNIRQLDEGGGGHGMMSVAPSPNDTGNGHGGMMTVAPGPDDGGGSHGGMMTVALRPDGRGGGHGGMTTSAPAPDEGGGGHGGMMTVAPGPDDGGGDHEGLTTSAPAPEEGGGGHGGMMTVAPGPDDGGGGHGGMMTVAAGPDGGGGGHGLMTAATGSHNQGASAITEPPQAREQRSSTTGLLGRETTTQGADQTTVTAPNAGLNQPSTSKPTVGK